MQKKVILALLILFILSVNFVSAVDTAAPLANSKEVLVLRTFCETKGIQDLEKCCNKNPGTIGCTSVISAGLAQQPSARGAEATSSKEIKYSGEFKIDLIDKYWRDIFNKPAKGVVRTAVMDCSFEDKTHGKCIGKNLDVIGLSGTCKSDISFNALFSGSEVKISDCKQVQPSDLDVIDIFSKIPSDKLSEKEFNSKITSDDMKLIQGIEGKKTNEEKRTEFNKLDSTTQKRIRDILFQYYLGNCVKTSVIKCEGLGEANNRRFMEDGVVGATVGRIPYIGPKINKGIEILTFGFKVPIINGPVTLSEQNAPSSAEGKIIFTLFTNGNKKSLLTEGNILSSWKNGLDWKITLTPKVDTVAQIATKTTKRPYDNVIDEIKTKCIADSEINPSKFGWDCSDDQIKDDKCITDNQRVLCYQKYSSSGWITSRLGINKPVSGGSSEKASGESGSTGTSASAGKTATTSITPTTPVAKTLEAPAKPGETASTSTSPATTTATGAKASTITPRESPQPVYANLVRETTTSSLGEPPVYSAVPAPISGEGGQAFGGAGAGTAGASDKWPSPNGNIGGGGGGTGTTADVTKKPERTTVTAIPKADGSLDVSTTCTDPKGCAGGPVDIAVNDPNNSANNKIITYNIPPTDYTQQSAPERTSGEVISLFVLVALLAILGGVSWFYFHEKKWVE